MEMGIKKLRDDLSILADKIPVYSSAIRNAGFTCCHNRDDWMEAHCAAADLAFHRRYEAEYAREAIMTDSPPEILFGDELNCHSAWLNELKAKRLKRHGPVDKLTKSWKTRHLVQLSPCLRELSRITDSPEPADHEYAASLVRAFTARWSNELVAHHEVIRNCAAKISGIIDEVSLQKLYAERLTDSFKLLGARTVNAALMYGREHVVAFSCGAGLEFVLAPGVSCSASKSSGMPSGKMGMGFRLCNQDTLLAKEYKHDAYVTLHLYELLPKEFIDYGRFKTPEEFCLNLLARTAACSVLVPDVLKILRGC